MALKIRLRRMGRKKAPTYRIVVAESSMPRDGRFVANIGHYNPRTDPMTLVVDRDKALAWMAKGAMPTDTTRSLLKRAGVFGPAKPEGVVEAVAEPAKKAGKAVKSAATKAVAAVKDAAVDVVDAVQDAVEDLKEAVTGDEEKTAEASEAEKAPEAKKDEEPDEAEKA
jgi:small subunit ribosomal protein S16